MPSDDTLARASFRSASSLMGLQLFSRLFTFILNQAMFRMAPPRAYGTAAIQFELLLSTILFLSREGIRNALLRGSKAKADHAMRNLSVLPILIGFPLALATACGYAHFAGHDVRSQAHFTSSIGVYALAALLELMSEPMHNLAMAELKTGVRVRAEGLGITTKTVVTFLVLLYDLRRRGEGAMALIAFAGGQLAYGAAVFATYVAAYGAGHLWITRPPPSSERKPSHYFDPETLRLSLTMTSQSVIKHFLTEGDKLILSWFSPLQDQGGYAVAVNYGSLVARIIFQPIEEASRGFFSKVLGGGPTSKDKTSHAALQQASTALVSLLSVQAAFSVFLVVFGTAYIPILLQVLLPRQYLATSAPQVLSAWVWYIPVLAFNGALEAFSSSVATPHDLNTQSRWMAVFSVVYILASVSFFKLHMGDASLVYANILNLSVRIIYSATFVSAFYTRLGGRQLLHWKSVFPGAQLFVCAAASAVLIKISSKVLKVDDVIDGAGRVSLTRTSVLLHIAVGGVLGLVNVGTWWITAGRYLSLPRTQHVKSQ